MERLKAQGTLSPEQCVEQCLDLLGPLEVGDSTRQELVDQVSQGGDIRWDSETAAQDAERRIGVTLALVAASREYQFA